MVLSLLKIRYLDLRLGSKCNLKCIMCSPHDSSMWVPDWIKLHPQIENESLKETMQWGNKGQIDGATYNWHKEMMHSGNSYMNKFHI